jgi:acyl dehydratase
MPTITNRTFSELQLGDSASLVRTLTHKDIELFAVVSGDVNPAHLDEDFAKHDIFHGVVAHGMWGGSLISAVLGTELPGPGTIYLDQTLQFRRPIRIGDVVTVTLTVVEKIVGGNRVILKSIATNQHGEEVITGTATVIAPTEKISRPRALLPEVTISEHAQ